MSRHGLAGVTARRFVDDLLRLPGAWTVLLGYSRLRWRGRRLISRLRIGGRLRPWIHTPDDGRGFGRPVYVDGVQVRGVWYADTRRGFVRAFYQPGRANRRRTAARWRKVRGVVVVQYRDGSLA